MGNNCTGARESAAAKLSNGVSSVSSAASNAKAYTRDTVEVSRMRMQGYKVQQIEDTSLMAPVTKWQQTLPLSRMTLNEYERRLKKLLDHSNGDEINKKQLIECFKDHY